MRSAWYLQELLQTFGDQIAEISMIPGNSGDFQILGQLTEADEPICIWDRKMHDGFPDSKVLKQKVRKLLFDDKVSIGKHNERVSTVIDKESTQDLATEKVCTACSDI